MIPWWKYVYFIMCSKILSLNYIPINPIGKLEFIIPYLNYLVFGPFTIGIIITILSNANKLMFICVRYKPENKIFNFKLVMFLFFASLISFLCTFFGILFFVDRYFDNSINYKPSGSYILGYIFSFQAIINNSIYMRLCRIKDRDI